MKIFFIFITVFLFNGCTSFQKNSPEVETKIEIAIRKAAEKPNGELTKEDLEKVKKLDLADIDLVDASSLVKLTQLVDLNLNDNSGINLNSVAMLTHVRGSIHLGNCNLSDITPLVKLRKLTYFILDRNKITDISPLGKLDEHCTGLWLDSNLITDLSPLFNLSGLERVSFADNPGLTNSEIDKLRKALPKCDIRY